MNALQAPVLETARCVLTLLRPENAPLLVDYKLRNQAQQGEGLMREGYARAYLKIAGRWEDMVLNALINAKLP